MKTHTNGHARMPASMAGSQPRTEQVLVTPELASKWLAQNTVSNRRVSIRTVDAYAVEMKAGRWLLTHQGIAFNRTGELVDGQHRLHAIVAAGVPIEMMVSTGLPIEYNSPIDQGYNRSLAQLLGKGTRWVSVVRGLVLLESGMPTASFKSTLGLIETCGARHHAAIDAVMAVAKNSRACPTGAVSALAYAYPVDINKILSFARQVDTGELLENGDPALSLRKWISQGRHTTRETILATLSAARYCLQGKKLMRITAGVSGEERDGGSNYVWMTMRRRALKIFEGTPGVDLVASSS
jgi:hypothetical protein